MKTRLFLLASISILAALLFSGVAFAEGEVPQAPAAEVPEAPAAEVSREVRIPGAEVPIITESAPAPAAEAACTTEDTGADEPIILEGAPAPEEPADTALDTAGRGHLFLRNPRRLKRNAQPEVSIIEPVLGEATLPAAETPAVIEPPLAVEAPSPGCRRRTRTNYSRTRDRAGGHGRRAAGHGQPGQRASAFWR